MLAKISHQRAAQGEGGILGFRLLALLLLARTGGGRLLLTAERLQLRERLRAFRDLGGEPDRVLIEPSGFVFGGIERVQ